MLKIRMLKKTVSVILAAVTAIVLCFSVTPSFADSSEVVYHETEKEAAAELRTHMKQREEKVTIGLMGWSRSEHTNPYIGKLTSFPPPKNDSFWHRVFFFCSTFFLSKKKKSRKIK